MSGRADRARSTTPLLIGLGLITAVAFCGSLLIGPAAIGLKESLAALTGGEAVTSLIILQEVRLPRAVLGLTIGATLGLSGAVLQGFLRNPLAGIIPHALNDIGPVNTSRFNFNQYLIVIRHGLLCFCQLQGIWRTILGNIDVFHVNFDSLL